MRMTLVVAACLVAGTLPALVSAQKSSPPTFRPSPPPYRAPTPPAPPPRATTSTSVYGHAVTSSPRVTQPVYTRPATPAPRVTVRPAQKPLAAASARTRPTAAPTRKPMLITSQPGYTDRTGRTRYTAPRTAHYGAYHWTSPALAPMWWPILYPTAPYTQSYYDSAVQKCIDDMTRPERQPTEARRRQCRRILREAGLIG